MSKDKPTHSTDAEHTHDIKITLSGVKDAQAAKKLLADLLSKPDSRVEIDSIAVQQVGDAQTFAASFPVCCFFREGEAYYGVCRFGVPGPCGAEYRGCPA